MEFPGNFLKVEYIINNTSIRHDSLAGYYHPVDVVKRMNLPRLLPESNSFRISDNCQDDPE